jgi:hypothetical protein
MRFDEPCELRKLRLVNLIIHHVKGGAFVTEFGGPVHRMVKHSRYGPGGPHHGDWREILRERHPLNRRPLQWLSIFLSSIAQRLGPRARVT